MSNSEDEKMIPPETKKVKLGELMDMLIDLPDCVK